MSKHMINHSKPWITEVDLQVVKSVLKSGFIAQGPSVKEFELAIANYIGVHGGVAVSSGTVALMLALKALDIQTRDEIILPTYVCHSVADAVVNIGAVPIFCDVGLHWNMTAESIAPLISSRTKAIIIVHLFGIPADSTSFKEFGLPIIEDCSQAFGAKQDTKKVGSVGDISVLSFHATKCLTTGEGGMTITDSKKLANKLLQMRLENTIAAPMSDIQAALGLSQLSRYPIALQRRRELAQCYLDKLPEQLTTTIRDVSRHNIFFRFLLTSRCKFDEVQQLFQQEGIAIRRGVDALLHRQYGLQDDGFPNALQLFNTTISIPIYPSLSDSEQGKVIQVCKQVLTHL
jgi:perosamine synthetase